MGGWGGEGWLPGWASGQVGWHLHTTAAAAVWAGRAPSPPPCTQRGMPRCRHSRAGTIVLARAVGYRGWEGGVEGGGADGGSDGGAPTYTAPTPDDLCLLQTSRVNCCAGNGMLCARAGGRRGGADWLVLVVVRSGLGGARLPPLLKAATPGSLAVLVFRWCV